MSRLAHLTGPGRGCLTPQGFEFERARHVAMPARRAAFAAGAIPEFGVQPSRLARWRSLPGCLVALATR
jgi:hypothetical protein